MSHPNGFHLTVLNDGREVLTIGTGDGCTQFTGLDFLEEGVGVAVSYGEYVGVGAIDNSEKGKQIEDSIIDPKFIMRFNNPASIDSLIRRLEQAKTDLTAKADKAL